ncbi:hypothetical protein BJ878DRAFT_525578 [Calycina marina]|uniref:Uncharacterized protein n=1 Tax=Calycina marina TaxID=1763456 RepID=A0A9P7YWT7_9HELO|nr:hypothetical protein BJ878DRAFT_525578 [Calycina marina]
MMSYIIPFISYTIGNTASTCFGNSLLTTATAPIYQVYLSNPLSIPATMTESTLRNNPEGTHNTDVSVDKYKSWGGNVFAPQYDNKTYTDDSITSVVVTNVIPSIKPLSPNVGETKSKVAKIQNIFNKGKGEKETGDGRVTKVVFMPRVDFKEWFAKDDNGVYVETEPNREWTEEELDEEFGAYRPAKPEQGINTGSIGRMLNASARAL